VIDKKSDLFSEITNLIDIAAKITLFFYSMLLFIGTTDEILKNNDFPGLFFIPIGIVFFVLHIIYSGKYRLNKQNFFNDIETASSFKRGVYYLLLSMSLAIFVMSFVNISLRESVQGIAKVSKVFGGVMATYVALFVYILLIFYFGKLLTKLSGKHILLGIFLIVILYLLFRYALYFIDTSDTAKDFGLFLLGPINILIIRFLSEKYNNKNRYLIRF
jgi:hypothetical protein